MRKIFVVFLLQSISTGCSFKVARLEHSIVILDKEVVNEIGLEPLKEWSSIRKASCENRHSRLNYIVNPILDSAFLTDPQITAFADVKLTAVHIWYDDYTHCCYSMTGTPLKSKNIPISKSQPAGVQ